jgi:hypothetical protein
MPDPTVSVFDYVAVRIERKADALGAVIAGLNIERFRRSPRVDNALSLGSIETTVVSCVGDNLRIAAALKDEPLPETLPDVGDTLDAQRALRRSARDVSAIIRTLTVADLERMFEVPPIRMNGAELILVPFRNLCSLNDLVDLVRALGSEEALGRLTGNA